MKRAITVICALAAIGFCGCNNDNLDWGSMTEVEKLIHSMDTPRQSVTEVLKSADIWEISKLIYYTEPDGKGMEYVSFDDAWDPLYWPIGVYYAPYHFGDERINIYFIVPPEYQEFPFCDIGYYLYEDYAYKYDDATKTLSLTPMRSRYANSSHKFTMKVHAYDRNRVVIEHDMERGSYMGVEYNYQVMVLEKSDRNLDYFKKYADFDTFKEAWERAKEVHEEFMNDMRQNH